VPTSRRTWLAWVLAIAVAACQSTIGSPAPAGSGQTPTSPTAASAAVAGQTDTDWGRIWDALPAGFPSYPGSAPAEEAATGPASAVLVIQGVEPKTIAEWIWSKLRATSYVGEGLAGPREDGSFLLDARGPAAGCRVQVSVAPLGGLTTVTVLYGASCPGP
jgi:hypothetical protein